MEFTLEKIFLPSVGVDLVFNMDATSPVSRASIIYDTDHKNQTITIAQPIVAVTKTTEYNQLHLTAIVHLKQRKTRIGISCIPVKFIENYPLANKATTKALVLQYTPPAVETNIRSAFRLPLGSRHTVKGKLIYEKIDFFTEKDFKIKDISFNGLGVTVSREKKKSRNPLMGITTGTLMPMGISLMDSEKDTPIGTFPVKVRAVRVNHNYSATHTLIGLLIEAIAPENEDLLIKFIHDAQIAELKRLSQKG